MGLLKRLAGEPAPSQEDLQKQAAEELKQMLGHTPQNGSNGASQQGAEQENSLKASERR